MEEKLILGTVQFGLDYGITNKNGKLNEDEIDKIFNFCDIHNILYFDTAQDYGISENILSKYSKLNSKFNIITKSKFKNKNIDDTIKISLNKFDKIECYMLHSYDDYKNTELLNKLISYKKTNKINKIGVSIYNVEEGIEILKDNIVDIIQLPFNYLDNQWFSEDFQNLIKIKKNIEIHVRSIFLQGILLNKPIKYPNNIQQNEFDKLEDIILTISKKLQLTKLELCFAYINSFEWINKFLIGIDNLEHLELNFNIINKNLKLTKEDIIFIQNITQNINQDIINPSKWIFN
jgi:aryl-alcohol dehydrogenase-like predicted oxidoreductase